MMHMFAVNINMVSFLCVGIELSSVAFSINRYVLIRPLTDVSPSGAAM